MNTVKTLRTFFGFSQQHFARYLSMSRSMLSLVEIDERELPGTANLKYAELTAFAFGKEGLAAQPKVAVTLTPEEIKILTDYATEYDYQAEKCRRQLAEIKLAHEQATHALALCAQQFPTLANNKEGKRIHLIMEILEDDAKKNLKRFGLVEQALLQWKMEEYVSGAKRAREMITQANS